MAVPLLEPKKPMTANAANRVKDAVERVVDKVEKAADGTAARLNTLSEKALDKFHQSRSRWLTLWKTP
jgi:hypothetical protein